MSYIGYNVYAAPGYEVVSTAYLDGLKQSAGKMSNMARDAVRREKELDAAKEEIGELKDILKQVLRTSARRDGVPHGSDYIKHVVLGDRPDVHIEISPAPGIFNETNRRKIRVWVPTKENPDDKILTALKRAYPYYSTANILQQIRSVGLDITLKDQGKVSAVNADATSLKLVS